MKRKWGDTVTARWRGSCREQYLDLMFMMTTHDTNWQHQNGRRLQNENCAGQLRTDTSADSLKCGQLSDWERLTATTATTTTTWCVDKMWVLNKWIFKKPQRVPFVCHLAFRPRSVCHFQQLNCCLLSIDITNRNVIIHKFKQICVAKYASFTVLRRTITNSRPSSTRWRRVKVQYNQQGWL